MEDVLKDYPVIIEMPVEWGDMDAFGHVNNVIFYRYFENSRIAYLEKIGLWEHMKKHSIGPILASSRCKYKVPLTYPDTVSIGSKVTQIEEDRFLMEHVIYSQSHDRIVAEGDGTIVIFDYSKNSKAPIPEHIISTIYSLEDLVSRH